jgi:hypothetical protein
VLQEEATKGGIAQLLENFFQDMEDQSLLGTPLDRGKEGSSLQLLHAELCKDDALSFLNHVDKQQDAQEFIIKLLALALNGHETFGLTGYTKRAPESLQAPKNALLEGIHIPSVDRPKGRSELESMVVVEIPDEAVVYSLNDFFEGTTREEPADFMDILNNERGHKSLENAPPEQVAAIEKASEYGDIIGTIEAKTTHRLDQPVPSFLPIYIPRFTEKGAKNTSEVRAPYRLSVPVKGGGTALYELKSVAVHSGATKQSGHYYTYLPDPSTVDPALGYPTRWIKASDSQEKRAVDWSTEAAQDISTNGVFFMYDRIGNAS